MEGTGIASHVPGRLRVRHLDLRSARRNAEAAAVMAAWDGVTATEGKPVCGSIVLRYDPDRASFAEMESRITTLLVLEPRVGKAAPAPAPPNPTQMLKRLNRPAKVGSMAALAGTLLALGVGRKLHAALGVLHVAFLLLHLANHRKKLLQ